ncbi:MAG: UDP-3-O-(3-hydroxymyristoyl)glucosamine N-acyltransferase [Candidatus Binatia bacterium]
MRLSDLAALLSCELEGDGDVEVTGVAPIERAGPGDLTFVANLRYLRHLNACRAAAVILGRDVPAVELPSLRTDDPYLAFARAVEHFHIPLAWPQGVHPSAQISATATVGPRASIGAFAVIGDGARIGSDARIAAHVVIYPAVTIGDRFTAHAHVTIREAVQIGDDVVLHAGAVVGSDGFGYLPIDGGIRRLIQSGNVVLEEQVEVGANTTVDRAMIGSTIIRRGAKLDNLVMIAHGCEVGEFSMLAGQVGLAGSTQIGKWVRLGGQMGAAGHLSIGDGAEVAAQSGVINTVPPGASVGGTPAVDMRLWRRFTAAWTRLPDLFHRLRRLERQLGMREQD